MKRNKIVEIKVEIYEINVHNTYILFPLYHINQQTENTLRKIFKWRYKNIIYLYLHLHTV